MLNYFLALLWLSSCSTSKPTSTLVSPPESVFELQSEKNPEDFWNKVLEKNVDEQGRINFKNLKTERQDLDKYIAYIARYSPDSHPEMFSSAEAKLAYYLNSYNALAMYGVVAAGIPKDFASFPKRLNFFKTRKYVVGGQKLALYDYENDVIRKLGEPRVHFGLNCMAVSCPTLPKKAFTERFLQAQLDAETIRFFNSKKNLQVYPDKKLIRVSEILKIYTSDFVNEDGGKSIIEFVNRYYQGEKIPEGYRVEFIPFDWRVNIQ